MTTQKPVQPLPEVLLASIRINISSTGRTSVIYESGEQLMANIREKKAHDPEQKITSRATSAATQGKVKRKAQKQLAPSDDQLKAQVSKAIPAITFDSKEDFEPDASEGMYKMSGERKKYFVAQDYLERLYPDETVRQRVLALMRNLGWLISGPHEINLDGIKCPMFKINLKAVKANS